MSDTDTDTDAYADRDAVVSVTAAAVAVLTTADPAGKVALTHRYAAHRRAGALTALGDASPPDRPARPAQPELRLPRDMPKRRKAGSPAGKVALLHALAHIELNAIDLAWDIAARFARTDPGDGSRLPDAFFDDWIAVADDEATHFALLQARLQVMGAGYGDLPAHDGLWQASLETAHDLPARLAVVPMVLEARGLDVTPAMIAALGEAGDAESAAVLQRIHDDEITHVAAGVRWFRHVCSARGCAPEPTWQTLVRAHFKGQLKPPFNDASRARAGLPASFYRPLVEAG